MIYYLKNPEKSSLEIYKLQINLGFGVIIISTGVPVYFLFLYGDQSKRPKLLRSFSGLIFDIFTFWMFKNQMEFHKLYIHYMKT